MMGVCLFIGFAVGFAACMATLCVYRKLDFKDNTPTVTENEEPHEENKELRRLQRQLDEINSYRGDAK